MLAWHSLSGPYGERRSRTPVRWLCLRAFCYLAATTGGRLRPIQLDQMSQLVDLGIFLNRCFDGKTRFSSGRYRKLRRGLPDGPVRDYLQALKRAETGRPSLSDWKAVQAYRRSVLDLSLQALFSLAELRYHDALSPLVCLIQLVDDILDRHLDRTLELPTLVTSNGPTALVQAQRLWEELKSHRRPEDRPLVALGFLVYLLARLCAHLCR